MGRQGGGLSGVEGYSQQDKGSTEEAEKLLGRGAVCSRKSGEVVSVGLKGFIRQFVTD